MSAYRPRLKVVMANALVAIVVILVFGLTASDAETFQPSPFLSPTGVLTPRAWLPVVLNNFPPVPTISRYVGNASIMDTTFFYNLGYSRGQTISTGQKVVVIVDFGYPAYDGTSGQYGTYLLVDHTFHSVNEIKTLSQEFLRGFYYGSPTGISLTLAVGVNNSDLYGTGNVSWAHGVAWAQMINNINSWIIGPPGPDWTDKLVAWGAVDAEPYFNTAVATRAWVDGYASAYTGQSKYLNFGSCDGCSYTNHGWGSPWQQDDIYHIAWGSPPAYSLPEIYLTNGINADQWYHMSLYGYNTYGLSIIFRGSLTQWNACQEQANPNYCSSQGIDNTPSQGFMQLYNAINADPHTARPMLWSSDMSWQK